MKPVAKGGEGGYGIGRVLKLLRGVFFNLMAKSSMTSASFRLRAAALAACCGVLLVGCGGGSSEESRMPTSPVTPPGPTTDELAQQERERINTAIDTAETAVAMVDDEATNDEVMDAEDAIEAIDAAIMAAANVPAPEKAAFTTTHKNLLSQLNQAKASRMMAMDDKKKADDAAMMKTAMMLYRGIGDDPLVRVGEGRRITAYDNNDIDVSFDGPDQDTDLNVSEQALKEDKEMMVSDLHGWTGKRYTASPAGGGMYEAYVYSDIEDSEPGKMFGHAGAANDDFEYQLTNGALTIDTSTAAVQGRVAGPGFDQTAGTKQFELPDNMVAVKLPGNSYHGVSGTYSCTPNTGEVCSATKASMGFTLGNGTWTFTPDDPNARVMSAPDALYASYGWWLHKSADGNTWTTTAFTINRGALPSTDAIAALNGSAMYKGGAVGKYSLHSTTGGTNDAGHFTASATLEANFDTEMITGTINNFMGADGKSRNWSVELKESGFNNTGTILGSTGDAGPAMETVWTMDDKEALPSGEWQGAFQDTTDSSGVPKVAIGTFSSTYNGDGRMVGAFGANKE